MKMYDHVKDIGLEEYSPKPQYVLETRVFTCPDCKQEISSKCYFKHYFWRKAVIMHMGTHGKIIEDETA